MKISPEAGEGEEYCTLPKEAKESDLPIHSICFPFTPANATASCENKAKTSGEREERGESRGAVLSKLQQNGKKNTKKKIV